MTRLGDQVAIITGSTGGIGQAIAEQFAEEGAAVIVSGRRIEQGEAVVAGIRSAGGEATFCQADVTDREQIESLIDAAVRTYGKLTILVNNAWSGTVGSVLEVEDAEWDQNMQVTLKAAYASCRLAIPQMIAAGGGSIINVSSVHGTLASSNYSPYDTAKAGLNQLSRDIALNFGAKGIRCNAIAPGFVLTPYTREYLKQNPCYERMIGVMYPVGRVGTMKDVAQAAVFLASDESSFITGHVLVVDGGLTIQLQDSVALRLAALFDDPPAN